MSIALHNIYVPAGFPGAKRPLFEGLDIEIPGGTRIGVLGAAKSGKSTLLRLICGTKLPEGGTVKGDMRTSWPIPLSTFFVNATSVARNIRFVARLYGIPGDDFPRRIATSVGIAEFLNTPIGKCPKFVKQRLALALGVGLDFDMYLFDGALTPVDKPFKEAAAEMVAGRMSGRGYVLVTSVPGEAEKHCDSVYVLDAGKARYFTETEKGIEYFKELLAAEKQKPDGEKTAKQAAQDDEETDIGDIDMVAAAVMDEL